AAVRLPRHRPLHAPLRPQGAAGGAGKPAPFRGVRARAAHRGDLAPPPRAGGGRPGRRRRRAEVEPAAERRPAARLRGRAAPARPQVLNVSFALDGPTPGPRALRADLLVEVAWDWEDRRPQQIELRGAFFPAGTTPPAAPPSGLQLAPGGPAGTAVLLTFDAA